MASYRLDANPSVGALWFAPVDREALAGRASSAFLWLPPGALCDLSSFLRVCLGPPGLPSLTSNPSYLHVVGRSQFIFTSS